MDMQDSPGVGTISALDVAHSYFDGWNRRDASAVHSEIVRIGLTAHGQQHVRPDRFRWSVAAIERDRHTVGMPRERDAGSARPDGDAFRFQNVLHRGRDIVVFTGDEARRRERAAVDPPPPLIWVRGHLALLHKPCVAIVGARIASAGGQRFARGLAGQLGAAEPVSGARGGRTGPGCPARAAAAGPGTSTRPARPAAARARCARGG